MRRIEGKGIDVVTTVHKLVGVAWIIGAVAVLVLVIPLARSSSADVSGAWARIATFQRVASYSSVVTLLIGLFYGLGTTWGFIRHRWVIGKWVLFLAATGLGGPSISAARSHSTTAVIVLTAAELAALAAAVGLGVFLERSRHSGAMAV